MIGGEQRTTGAALVGFATRSHFGHHLSFLTSHGLVVPAGLRPKRSGTWHDERVLATDEHTDRAFVQERAVAMVATHFVDTGWVLPGIEFDPARHRTSKSSGLSGGVAASLTSDELVPGKDGKCPAHLNKEG